MAVWVDNDGQTMKDITKKCIDSLLQIQHSMTNIKNNMINSEIQLKIAATVGEFSLNVFGAQSL